MLSYRTNATLNLDYGSLTITGGDLYPVGNIDITGKIGINTYPQVGIDVYASMRVKETATLVSPTSGAGLEFYYRIDNSLDDAVIQSYDRDSTVFRKLHLYGSTVCINDSGIGNVGIGTTVATEKLQVYGSLASVYYGADWGTGTARAIMDFVPGDNIARFGQANGTVGDGYIQFITCNTVKAVILGNGNVGIGLTNPTSAKLQVIADTGNVWTSYLYGVATANQSYGLGIRAGTSNADMILECWDYAGNVRMYVRGDAYTWVQTDWAVGSDRRLKENITYIIGDVGLKTILKLKPAKFDLINSLKDNIGFIAQDVEEVIPEAISLNSDGMLSLKSSFIIPYLVKAIQEADILINENKKQIELLLLELEKLKS
jgi:hypothetical protein